MLGQVEVILNLVETVVVGNLNRIFLAIDSLQLERTIDLGKRHGGRVGTQRLEQADKQRIVGRSQGDSVEIFGGGDRCFPRGDITKGTHEKAEPMNV